MAGAPTNLRTVASSMSGLKGFTIHPLAPACLALVMSPGCPSVVSMTTSRSEFWPSRFKSESISIPFMRGMFTSQMTIAMSLVVVIFSAPSIPSEASSTS